MPNKHRIPMHSKPARRDRPPRISLPVIRRFARQVAERFGPDRIILFGSYAYGQPDQDSDVDLLVVMPARNQHDQAVKIRWAVPAPFPMDLVIRTPQNLQWRLAEGDSFLREVMAKGKVFYEKADRGMGAEGRSRRRRRAKDPSKRSPLA